METKIDIKCKCFNAFKVKLIVYLLFPVLVYLFAFHDEK